MTTNKSGALGPLITIITVFFFWGFVAASNGIFIPFCKAHFHLSQLQSQLIDTAFFAAYFIGSLVLWASSQIMRVDFLNKIGYRNGIIYGLIISTIGALSMIPAVNSGSFSLILGSFFIIALGFSLQQTSAQPFVIALGNPESGAHRLNLAGGVNSLGTLLGPIMVSVVLFGNLQTGGESATISNINTVYYILAIVFCLAILLLALSKLPTVKNNESVEPGLGALKFPQLRWGMFAIFIYVGVEVSIPSNMGALLQLPEFGGFTTAEITPFISLYWGSLMIGRWTAALSVFNLSNTTKRFLQVALPFIAFGLVLFANTMRGSNVESLYMYAICVAVMIIAFIYTNERPIRMLLVFSAMGMLAMLIGMMTTGMVSIMAFISGGLFCSILWPCIFPLSIAGLGKFTSQGSSLLIMMILGGALVPPLQGYIADHTNIHFSYWITVICFGYLAFYAIKTRNILKNQGLDFDAPVANQH
jgi:MFS transporter, FHS family, L-fucose permease